MGCVGGKDPSKRPLVLITGVTGYLGAATCLLFLKDGSYRVRGTVRSQSNEAKLKPLRDGLGDLFAQLEIVEADLMDETSLEAAIEGATYVIHTASPFHFNGGCVAPAVSGTNAIMKSSRANGVKHIVITSSLVAAQCPAAADRPKPPWSYNENFWSNPDRPEGMNDYFKSKTLAERAAWTYQKAHPSVVLTTILPCSIMGPSPCQGDDSFSDTWMRDILKGGQSEVQRGCQSFVDVRDVALAHLRAIQIPEAANRRFILFNGRILKVDFYGWLAEFNDRGAKVPTNRGEGEDKLEGDLIDNSRSKEVLKIQYTPVKSTFMDHAEHLFSTGIVP